MAEKPQKNAKELCLNKEKEEIQQPVHYFSEKRRPEILAKNGRFLAKTGGLESL